MTTISASEFLDLNKLGIAFSVPIALFVLSLNIALIYKLLCVAYLLVYGFWLWKKAQKAKNLHLLLTPNGDWQFRKNDEVLSAELKDYWKLKGFLCVWLQAEGESLSILVSRSIIGAEKFSKLFIHLK